MADYDFQDIETRAVLQLLADTSGLNIVVSDTVAGNVTLRLQNVPWDQALDIILQTKGLDMRKNGNIVLIAPREELALLDDEAALKSLDAADDAIMKAARPSTGGMICPEDEADASMAARKPAPPAPITSTSQCACWCS